MLLLLPLPLSLIILCCLSIVLPLQSILSINWPSEHSTYNTHSQHSIISVRINELSYLIYTRISAECTSKQASERNEQTSAVKFCRRKSACVTALYTPSIYTSTQLHIAVFMTQSHFVFRSMVYAVHCAESNPCRKIQSIFANQNDMFWGQKNQRETEWRGEWATNIFT